MADGAQITQVQRVPSPSPQAFIDTADHGAPELGGSLDKLTMFASANGDISDLLEPSQLTELGVRAVREWELDEGSRAEWKRKAEKALDIAAQERQEEDEREPLWEDGANIHAPALTLGALQFAAKATPDLIRGDQVVGIKVFTPPAIQPGPEQAAQAIAGPQPAPQQVAQLQQGVAQAQGEEQDQAAKDAAKNARGERVKHYLNYLIFYKMDGWEDETDQLLHEVPVVGSGFKKVYMGTSGLCSDYVSALRLCVHNDTKSIYRCPRITQDFEVYPYEIEDRIRAGVYRDADLPEPSSEDPEAPRQFIEQHRLDDLDGDGHSEPYIVTVDVDTKTVMRVEAAYTADDIKVDQDTLRVTRIERWLPFAPFKMLPDMKGRFYGMGFGRLLESISDSTDTIINQLLDAGTAQIAGGGFIASGVRLQAGGQGGVVYQQPGEYGVVNVAGGTLQDSIWERTVPRPSPVSFQLLELLLDWGKEITSTQNVVTGDAPSTAPVGTTYALQNQALMSYRACFKRMFRGFKDEFRLMYLALKRWATDRERQEYTELTGGDLDQDFSGDGTDIQPVADPSVVTKMQKMARNQTLTQLAESPVGMAAGMTQPAQAQNIMTDILTDMDYDQPRRYVGPVQPNPLEMAKAADMQATAQERTAKAAAIAAKTPNEAGAVAANTTLTHAKAVRELGLAAKETHDLHKEADRIAQTGSVADAEQLMDPAEEAEADRQAAKESKKEPKAE